MSETTGKANWLHIVFLTLTPLLAITLIPYYALNYGFILADWIWFGVFMMGTGLGITMGYHRLWSHKTFKAHWTLRTWLAFWGAASCQGSILEWSQDHRDHHRFVDVAKKDPYAASRGFWFSHIGWILFTEERYTKNFDNCKDLLRDPVARLQHKYFWPINFFMNGVVPLSIGFAMGRPLAVFLLAFLLRVVLNHHFTFFINSLAHIWGRRPYSNNNTSRDNDLLALFTYGEGYHNFHHTFQHDYRNGIQWWAYDPSKWIIKSFSWVGITRDLKLAGKDKILKAKANMQLQKALLKMQRQPDQRMREKLEHAHAQLVTSLNEWSRVKRHWLQVKRDAVVERIERIEARNRYVELKYMVKMHRRQWRLLMAEMAAV